MRFIGKYGAYLLACYDPDREEYQSVCKIGTGFTDEVLLSFWTELKEYTMDKRPRYYKFFFEKCTETLCSAKCVAWSQPGFGDADIQPRFLSLSLS